MVQLLNKKLEQMQLNYEDVNKERDRLREVISLKRFLI